MRILLLTATTLFFISKVGAMKLQALRKKYEKQLGTSFNIAAFHNEILKDGAMPLDILEEKMDAWGKSQKKQQKL